MSRYRRGLIVWKRPLSQSKAHVQISVWLNMPLSISSPQGAYELLSMTDFCHPPLTPPLSLPHCRGMVQFHPHHRARLPQAYKGFLAPRVPTLHCLRILHGHSVNATKQSEQPGPLCRDRQMSRMCSKCWASSNFNWSTVKLNQAKGQKLKRSLSRTKSTYCGSFVILILCTLLDSHVHPENISTDSL